MKRITYCFHYYVHYLYYHKQIQKWLRTIYTTSLTNGQSYEWLDHLSNQIGGRLSGSLNAEKAVQYTKEELEKLGLDKVWLQPVMVPKWVKRY